MTFQPARRNLRRFLESLALFPPIFFFQKGESFLRQTGNLHPCQKSPSTKMVVFDLGRRKSGRLGRFYACFWNLIPAFLRYHSTILSGLVFLERIFDMRTLRFSGLIISPRPLPTKHLKARKHHKIGNDSIIKHLLHYRFAWRF
jgi:hypothetical protein